MIYLRKDREIDLIRQCGRTNSLIHERVRQVLEPGVATRELNEAAARAICEFGVKSSIRDAYGFPGDICVSVNSEVGHGIPGGYKVREGDIVKVDISVELDGFHTDAARTYTVGECPYEARNLIRVSRKALEAGIARATAHGRCSDISNAIATEVHLAGYRILRHAFGHGIGESLHESPAIANFGPAGLGPKLREGMVLAIEPVIAARSQRAFRMGDWTDVTEYGDLSAHVEHTILVTNGTPQVLTSMEDEQERVDSVEAMGGADIRLRVMEEADRVALLALAAQEMDPILMAAWGRRTRASELFGDEGAQRVVIEDLDGNLLGLYVWSQRDDCVHVHTIVIDGRCQGKGIGTYMMSRLKDLVAKRPELSGIELCVQTNNHIAIRFYERMGFRRVGAPYANTYLMRWSIT